MPTDPDFIISYKERGPIVNGGRVLTIADLRDERPSSAALVIPTNPDLERESAARLGLIEPILNKSGIRILTGRSNIPLAEKVARHLELKLDRQPISVFCDTNGHYRIRESVRGGDIYIVQTLARSADGSMSINDSSADLFAMLRAAKRADADKVRLIIPFFGFSRSDKREQSREPVLMADYAQAYIDAGAHSILTMDLHNPASEGSTPEAMDVVSAIVILLPEIRKLNLDMKRVVIVSPDSGGVRRANQYSELLGLGKSAKDLSKYHPKDNQVEFLNYNEVLGDLNGATVIIVDDMLDTCGTTFETAIKAKQLGADKIIAVASHSLMSIDTNKPIPDPYDRLNHPIDGVIDLIITTDSVAQRRIDPRIKIVSCSPLLASAIDSIHNHRSVGRYITSPSNPNPTLAFS